MIKFNICEKCGKEFKVYERLTQGQKECPHCRQLRDVNRGRKDSVTISRKKIFSAPVLIVSLPSDWQRCAPIKSNASEYWKMEVRGSQYGLDWDGQITIYSHLESPPKSGDVVYMRVMESEKLVTKVTFGNHVAILPLSAKEEDTMALITSGRLMPDAIDGEWEKCSIKHEYIVLDGTHREPEYELSWQHGLPPERSIWQQSIYGGNPREIGTLFLSGGNFDDD